jgi:hypothetical protein
MDLWTFSPHELESGEEVVIRQIAVTINDGDEKMKV